MLCRWNGGTFSGLLQAAPEQEVLGFVVVQDPEDNKYSYKFAGINKNWELLYDMDLAAMELSHLN